MKQLCVFVGFALFLGCTNTSDQGTHELIQNKASSQIRTLEEVQRISLRSEAETPPVEITSLQIVGEHLYILDTFPGQQAYVYGRDGVLQQLIGRTGTGPGEYRMPGGFCLSGDRFHLVSAGRTYHLYDKQGQFITNNKATHPGGIGNKIYPGRDQTAYLSCYSRHLPDATIYHVDENGDLLGKFSPPDQAFSLFWDQVHPMGNLVVADEVIYQIFVHKYEVLVFQHSGELLEKKRLASPIYREPDYEVAKTIGDQSHEKQMAFMKAHSLINGFYPLGDGFITVLAETSLGPETQVIEFWRKDFFGQGRALVPQGEKVVGSYENQLIFYNEDNQLIFRKLAE